MAVDLTRLYGTWIHSSEESTDDRWVFRGTSYDFPPVRAARRSLTFRPDGVIIRGRPGAADASVRGEHPFSVKGSSLVIGGPNSEEEFEIESIGDSELVLKKRR